MAKVVVVTGASKGIGAATAIAFGNKGYDVIVNYLSDKAGAETVANSVEAAGGKAVLVKADVFTEAGIDTLFAAITDRYKHIDVFVNNAGLPEEPDFGNLTLKDITASLAGNFGSAVLCSQKVVPLMKKDGCILFTSSIYGTQFGGHPGLPLYSAGKAAMINFTASLAENLAPNIRCNCVAPGFTRTPSWNGISEDYVTASLAMTLQKEWVEASEIADTFVFLAETPHINAQTIVVDAGWQKKFRKSGPRHS